MKTENEKAFACTGVGSEGFFLQEGMDLRDWFAGQVLKSLINNPNKQVYGAQTLKTYPKYAYEFADAMMKARSEIKE